MLTSCEDQVIFLDGIGNPVSDGTWSCDWHHGRQLERIFGEGPNGYVEVEYTYDANGLRTEKTVTNMVFENVGTRTGLFVCSDGEIRYFTNGQPTYAGLIQDENGDYYYIRSSLVATRNRSYYVTLTNGLLPTGEYMFGADGRMIVDEAYGENGNLFTGLRQDADGEIRYYVNGVPTYAGLVQDEDGDYYYINSSMTAVRGQSYYVTMTNGLLPEDTYTFDEDGRMVDPPEPAVTYSTSNYQVLVPDETVTYRYTYNGGSLTQMTAGDDTLYFAYAGGAPMSVTYNGTTYYYVTNLQGDVIAILNTAGTAVVEYTYDAWGNILTTTGTMASTLGQINPLRYRGYVYDSETGLYYLQSRYYDPEVGRFLNADAFPSTGQGILGNNMFAYCRNSPVFRCDPAGSCDWEVLGKGIGRIVTGISAIVAGAAVFAAGAPAVLIAVAAVTIGAGILTAANGAADIQQAATGGNFVRDKIFSGNQTAYNIYSGAVEAVAIIGTYVCGNYLKQHCTMQGAEPGTEGQTTLHPGQQLDRYGSKYGRYLTDPGTPPDMLALPTENTGQLTSYIVQRPFTVQTGVVAACEWGAGGGFQYFSWMSVERLVQFGYLAVK